MNPLNVHLWIIFVVSPSFFIAHTLGQVTNCYDSYECQNSSVVSNYIIECSGLGSCSNTSRLETDEWNIECYGEKSCFGSQNITEKYSTSGYVSIYCDGDMSCAFSNIFIFSKYSRVQGNGYLSLFGATIRINSNNSWISFNGVDAGRDATVICKNGLTCWIDCWGDACSDIYELRCSDYGMDCTFDIDCRYAYYSSICPTGYNVSSEYLVPDLYSSSNTSFKSTSYKTGYLLCYNESIYNTSFKYVLLCSAYGGIDCAINTNGTGKIFHSLNDGVICCVGEFSCAGTGSMINQGYSDSNYGNKISIRCDAVSSCQLRKISAPNGGNIYFTAYFSGASSKVNTTRNYDIYITARSALQSGDVSNCNNVYITGKLGCDECEIHDIGGSVFGYGASSVRSTNISQIVGNVYCAGYSACFWVNLTVIQGDVYAAGYGSLRESIIKNIYGSVIATGYYGLYKAVVTDVDQVSSSLIQNFVLIVWWLLFIIINIFC